MKTDKPKRLKRKGMDWRRFERPQESVLTELQTSVNVDDATSYSKRLRAGFRLLRGNPDWSE